MRLANKEVKPYARFVGDSPSETIHNCSQIVEFIADVLGESETINLSKQNGYACFLVLRSVSDALEWERARTQNQRKPESEVKS